MEKNIKLSRDCYAMLIPSGVKVLLLQGCVVNITHKLAGCFTVRGVFGMARIEGADADALGLDSAADKQSQCQTAAQLGGENRQPQTPENSVEEADVWAVAKTVFDNGKKRVEADMTLTAPGCSMGPTIAEDLRMRIEALPSVSEAKVNIVWDPPWNKDMMSEEARMILGLA